MKLSCCSVIVATVLAFGCLVAAERGVSLDAVKDTLELLDDLPDACDGNNSDGPTWTLLKKDDKKVMILDILRYTKHIPKLIDDGSEFRLSDPMPISCESNHLCLLCSTLQKDKKDKDKHVRSMIHTMNFDGASCWWNVCGEVILHQ
jgi:hypothetical protein